jgi:secernin
MGLRFLGKIPTVNRMKLTICSMSLLLCMLSSIKCLYVEIPQVEHTNAVLLAKPFWIWGAEMGADEHGMVIGNEGASSKMPDGKENGLIGKDFLRLGLE